jgi:glucose/arabinose dehydrogenase
VAAQSVEPEVVVSGLDFPTGIAFSPDGNSMYVNERAGRVLLVTDDGLQDDPLATIPTTTAGETGLLGIAVSPDGNDLYLFASDPGGSSNRVLRVPATGGSPDVVVDGLPASLYHNGGGVAFDEDGLLLVSNGEIHDSGAAQNPDVLGGKVYRFTPEGDAADNPFGNAIALGLRNPYGLTVDPFTGDAFVTDNGPSSHDEINRIRVGGNYGWPDLLGAAGDASPSGPGEYYDPITVQEEIVVPTGIAIADDNAASDARGDLFYGAYGEQTIRRVELDQAREEAVSDEIFVQESEPVIALEWGPRGLYYSTPSTIKVIELAAERERGRDQTPSARDEAADVPPITPDPGTDSTPLVFLAIGVVIAGAVIAFVARR